MVAIKDALRKDALAEVRASHPEITPRKSATVFLGEITITCQKLGGVELSVAQALAMYHAHLDLLKKESGSKRDNPSRKGKWANSFSQKIVDELKPKLHRHANLAKPDLVATAK